MNTETTTQISIKTSGDHIYATACPAFIGEIAVPGISKCLDEHMLQALGTLAMLPLTMKFAGGWLPDEVRKAFVNAERALYEWQEQLHNQAEGEWTQPPK